MPGADRVERDDKTRGRLRDCRLRYFLFRSRYLIAGRGCRDPAIANPVEKPRRHGGGAQSGARPSLVSANAWPALSGDAIVDAGHRPLPTEKYPSPNPPPPTRPPPPAAHRDH